MAYPKLILIPIITGIIIFAVKIIIRSIKGNFSYNMSFDYGGMPSIHTAFVISLSTVIFISEGVFSAAFAISTVFSLIIIRDSLGFRRIMGFQSEALNKIIAKYPEKEKEGFPDRLEKHMGHTLAEVAVGVIVSIVLSVMLYLIIP